MHIKVYYDSVYLISTGDSSARIGLFHICTSARQNKNIRISQMVKLM